MAYKLYLKIDVIPNSLNKKLRRHWRRNHEENRAFDMLIACEVSEKGAPPSPLEKANISIVRHNYRTLDFDGLVGSIKPVVDSLVTAGVIKDDSWKVTGKWNVDQRFRPKKEGPLLEVIVQSIPSER